MNPIKRESVLTLPKGQIIVAVYPDGKKKSFFTKGLGYPGDTERKFQIENLGPVEKFLFPTIEQVTNILDAHLNKVE